MLPPLIFRATIAWLHRVTDEALETLAGRIAELAAGVSRDALATAERLAAQDARIAAQSEQLSALAAEVERLKTPAPAPTPTPAPGPTVPPVAVTINDVTYTVAAEHTRESLAGTDRYEVPLPDGLWFVLHDTPRLGRADYIIERRNPAVYGAALPAISYTATVADPRYLTQPAQLVAEGHGQHQRYRAQSKPWPLGTVDRRHVFGVSPRCLPKSIPAVPEPSPLSDCGLEKAMGNTGLRADIGPYTGWLARGIRTGDLSDAVRNVEGMAAVPWHVRDAEGRIVMLSGPAHLSRQMETWYGTHSAADNTIRTYVGGWRPDNAHAPKSAWSGFAANPQDPDPFVIEELQFAAAAVISQAAGSFTRSKSGLLITREQVRDFAWGMVALVQARVATPETVPAWLLPRSAFDEIIEANLALAHGMIGQSGFDRVSVALGKFRGTTTAGAIKAQSNVADYIPLAMAHCYQLTGDVRFIEIGRAHLDGRIAKRWKASPKYAALYPPVTIGTGTDFRFFDSWDEAYAARGWVSKPGDETGGWLRPTGTEAGSSGALLMPYTSDEMIAHTMLVAQLYRGLGFSTPDIDWLADYLEARSAGGGFPAHEQFAVVL